MWGNLTAYTPFPDQYEFVAINGVFALALTGAPDRIYNNGDILIGGRILSRYTIAASTEPYFQSIYHAISGGTFVGHAVEGGNGTVINDAGVIAGDYSDATGIHGYVDDHGVFTTVDGPGRDTYITGISDSGLLTGYSQTGTQQNLPTIAFIATPDATAITITTTLPLSGADYGDAYTVAPGGLLIGKGSVTNHVTDNGTVAASHGTLILEGGVTGSGSLLVHVGGTMVLQGATSIASVDVRGVLDLADVTLTGKDIFVAPGATLAGEGTVIGHVLTAGTVEAKGGRLQLDQGLTGPGTVSVDYGATLAVCAASCPTGISDNGRMELWGNTVHFTSAIISATGFLQGPGAFLGSTTDDGVIEASGGALKLGAVAGSGNLRIAAASSLELTGPASTDVTFLAGSGSLQLDRPADFTGSIDGFAAGDALVFKFATVSSASLLNGLLTVAGSGGTVASLHLQGLADGTAFTVSNAHTLTIG